MAELPDPAAFGAAFQRFLEAMSQVARTAEAPLADRLEAHLGADPAALPSTLFELAPTEHANLQLGLDATLPEAEVIGFSSPYLSHTPTGLAEVLADRRGAGRHFQVGPVRYTEVEVGDGRVVQCVGAGLFLDHRDGVPVVLAVTRGQTAFGGALLRVEGMAPERGAVPALLAELRAAMREHNVFRGRVISLDVDDHQTASVSFHPVPALTRDALILPDGTLERLERQAIGVSAQAERLRAGGRHLKRGVLLHGPPGTGKTLSVSYLLGAMTGRTTVLLTGRGLGLVSQAVAIARDLAPATVVFEDVDLVAAERTMPYGNQGVLAELLNQMEGVAPDEDLLFLLTTNRPDLLEPALAARPGRVDLALEIPLPDEEARRRLLRLYAGGALDPVAEAQVVARTEGTPGAFFRELMREAALRAALEERDAPDAGHVLAALDELLSDRAALTRRLLGGPPAD